VVEFGGGSRIPLREHPTYSARWQDLRHAISHAGVTSSQQLDRVADLFLVVEVGRAAMREVDDATLDGTEVTDTQEKLKRVSAHFRQAIHRHRATQKQGRPAVHPKVLEAPYLEQLRARFVASVRHASAVDRFNAAWTEADYPSDRQLTDDKAPPLIILGRTLIGELGYSVADAARLLAAAGYTTVSASASSGEKSPAYGLLETALKRDRRKGKKLRRPKTLPRQ
jgi:hypothetical protein